MLLNRIKIFHPSIRNYNRYCERMLRTSVTKLQTVKTMEINHISEQSKNILPISPKIAEEPKDLFPPPRVVPMILSNKESIVLPFDDVPGPKSLKYLSAVRYYLSEIGTQITTRLLTFGLNIGTYIKSRKSIRNLSALFDEYGPVVRFVSPVGRDIVLINHPEHIQKVFTVEGDYPVRSTVESLDKYHMEHRNHVYSGFFTVQGKEWFEQRCLIRDPLLTAGNIHVRSICEMCDRFTHKVYNTRNYQDEVSKDFYKQIHKWAFDCMGLTLFSKKFTMIDTELVNSQCDMSWMYHSLEKATEAVIKCETGLRWWKITPTPAWLMLTKYCDNLDNLIGKYVLAANKALPEKLDDVDNSANATCLIDAILLSNKKLAVEDISTIVMDMLLIGVNTIASASSYLLYFIAKHQKAQKKLYEEIGNMYANQDVEITKIMENTPYLQACIKETLRLVPPIPLLTRILPKNITLDGYNIPQGTLIIMSTQDSSLKDNNYDNAGQFSPERWLNTDADEYHAFASIPFGFGARRCLGQNIAETMISLLTMRVLQKFKLEYHYGDVQPTRTFISKPSKPIKIRFIDRI